MTSRVRSLPWRQGQTGTEEQPQSPWGLATGASRSALAVYAAALVIGIVNLVISEPTTLFWDFRSAYYPAGATVLHGASLSPLIHKGIWGFVNLPLLAWLFAPFALVPAKIAALIFALLGLGALAIAYLLLAELAELSGLGRAWLLLAMAANGPLIYSLKLGNTSHIVLAMLAGGLWLLRRNKGVFAGTLLGLAALIKLPLLLFGVYFILRRQGPAVLGFFGLIIGAGALSIAVFGLPLHMQWYEDAIRVYSSHVLAAFNVQSLQSFALRLHEPPPPLADWRLYLPSPDTRLWCFAVTLLFYALMVWTCAWPKRLGRTGTASITDDREYMALIVLCLISSPLSWTHYYCWLLLPAAFFIGEFGKGHRPSWIAAVAILLATPPVMLLHLSNPTLATLYEKGLVSTYLFGGVIFFALLTLTRTSFQPTDDNRFVSAR